MHISEIIIFKQQDLKYECILEEKYHNKYLCLNHTYTRQTHVSPSILCPRGRPKSPFPERIEATVLC